MLCGVTSPSSVLPFLKFNRKKKLFLREARGRKSTMKLTHGFKGLEITISWSFDILFRHNSWNYFPPAILHMLSRLTTLVSVSGQSRYELTLHLRISQTPLSVKCQFIAEIQTTKMSGNFGPKLNGSVQSNRKSFEKLVHLLRWTTFPGQTRRNFGWMDRADLENTAESTADQS